MSYNPQIHHRRSTRLKGYDYSQAGLYFITICCENKKHRFGEIVGAGFTPALDKNGPNAHGENGPNALDENGPNTQMILNDFGMVAYNEWIKLSERFTNFELDVFQIMPNHMHGIIMLNVVWATLAVAQNDGVDANRVPARGAGAVVQNDGVVGNGAPARGAPTVGDIVGAYKSLVANACIEICNAKNIRLGKLWQRNYHEHIIRNEQSYHTISEYIINNPAKWANDKFYTK